MGTDIRPEITTKSDYQISKHRYYELKHFCLQYIEWKAEYTELNTYVLKAVTEGLSYDILKARFNIPCCRNVYYDIYRRFFWLLDKSRKQFAEFTVPLMKGGTLMKELIARNPKQLDLCLRLLFAEGIQFQVRLFKTEKGKVLYGITLLTDDKTASIVEEKYFTLTR